MSRKPRICSFESRRGDEMRSLIERHGGEPTVVASMQEVPLEDNTVVLDFADRMNRGEVDYVVFMTGVGAETLRAALEQTKRFDAFLEDLRATKLILRGPKPKAVLHKWGLRDFLEVAEPNTWRELLQLIDDQQIDLQNQTVAIQEYGITNAELNDGLVQRGAKLLPVPVYRWKLPDDIEPLQQTISRTIAGDFDALMFTSANQIRNLLTVATETGQKTDLLDAAASVLICSIGPTCSDAIRATGLEPGFEASPPKMAQLVKGAISHLGE